MDRERKKKRNESATRVARFLFLGKREGSEFGWSPLFHIPLARDKTARWGVERMNEDLQARAGQRHFGGVAGGTQRSKMMPRWSGGAQGAPPGTLAVNNVRAKRQTQSKNTARSAIDSSGTSARCAWRNETIREKIIGHRMSVGAGGFGRGRIFRGEDGALAPLNQPASQHCGRVFLEPLVEQIGNLLAEIGSVSKAGKLIGLQSSAGSGEKKFPRSLGTELRHVALLKAGLRKNERDINTEVISEASTFRITRLWKSVEKKENVPGLCSGCAGDYEDPDRSAWEKEEVGEEREVDEVEEAKDVKDGSNEVTKQ
jgi:hypothetical protein